MFDGGACENMVLRDERVRGEGGGFVCRGCYCCVILVGIAFLGMRLSLVFMFDGFCGYWGICI